MLFAVALSGILSCRSRDVPFAFTGRKANLNPYRVCLNCRRSTNTAATVPTRHGEAGQGTARGRMANESGLGNWAAFVFCVPAADVEH